MNERSIQHATFVIERTYDASPARVFAAWADPIAKARWFPKPDLFDFRVGGREVHRGAIYTYDARYQNIIPEQRIVYTYTLDRNETRISVSVTTVEFKPAGAGTQLIFTEQGAFLDGEDKAKYRERGTKDNLDNLDAALRRELTPDGKS